MKQLISVIDRSIKRRNRLFIGETEEETKQIQEKRERIQWWKPVKLIALTLYMLLPFFEKPGWCIQNPEIDTNTTEGYWYCQNADGFIANSHLPKLPATAINGIFVVCLLIMFYFTKVRDGYRKRDEAGDTVQIQLWMMGIGICNLLVTIVVLTI